MIEVTNDVTRESLNRIQLILSGVPKGAEKALGSVISRAQSTVRTTAVKEITKVYSITQRDVKAESNIRLRTITEDGGVIGTVSFSGFKIPLYRFNVTPKTPTPRRNQHVKAAQIIGNPQVRFNNAFIAKMKSGHIGMFERDGRKRTPISEFAGSSVAQMAGNAAVLDKVEAAALETIEKRTEHEITRILNGYGGKK